MEEYNDWARRFGRLLGNDNIGRYIVPFHGFIHARVNGDIEAGDPTHDSGSGNLQRMCECSRSGLLSQAFIPRKG